MSPLGATVSILFHMCGTEKQGKSPAKQVVYSNVHTQLRHNPEHSLAIVFPLFQSASDGRGRPGEDFRVKRGTVEGTYVWVCICLRLCLSALHVYARPLCDVVRFLLSAPVWAGMSTADRGQHLDPWSVRLG